MKFSDLGLHGRLLEGIASAGFTDCMPVQEKVLPVSLSGKDVMVQSKTGSGKTAVFLVTVLQNYLVKKDAGETLPVALIVAPTRELAVQIEADAKELASGIKGFRVGCFYGGVGYQRQDKLIEQGCDIYVGTPGRLLDYHKMHKLDYRMFSMFIVDEADRMFDMGFYPDIQKMFSLMRPAKERQTMLFSATLGTKVRNLAWNYMNEPAEIEVEPEEITVKAICQELYHISKTDKFKLFLQVLTKESPDHALIFTNTKSKAVEISKRLNLNGFKAEYLMGDMPQSKRLKTILRMKEGDIKYLVATDVAARGLQIDDLALVVNYDIPEDFESYVHRIGRTARAGKSGKAITFACEEYVYGLEPIETYIQMKIPVIWPDEHELPQVEDKSAGMRYRDLMGEEGYAHKQGQRKPGQKPAPRSGSRPPVKKGQVPDKKQKPAYQQQKKKASAPTQYQKVGSMDLDQRVEYYKQKYAGDLKAEPKKVEGSVPKTEEKKKPGFFKRLFAKKS